MPLRLLVNLVLLFSVIGLTVFLLADKDKEIINWAKTWSLDARFINDYETIHEIESSVGEAVDKGIWMPDILQIRNPKFVKALKASFDYLSIPYQQQSAVEEIIVENNKVSGVRTKQKIFFADKVIIASGAWSAQFSVTESSVNVLPVKGQMIMYKGAPGLITRMVLSEGHYIIPRKDGRVLAGSTLEKIGFDKSISSDALDELHKAAVELVPGRWKMTDHV